MLNRNKILGEESVEEEGEDTVNGNEKENDKNTKNTFTPQYVNIRRQRPSTTDEPSTSKYIEIRRGTTDSNEEKDTGDKTSKYV